MSIKPIEQIPISRLRDECKYFKIPSVGLTRQDMILELKSKGLEHIDVSFPAKPPVIDVSDRSDDLSNVFIGNGAGKNERRSNQLYIANNDTSTPLIGGDFNSGVVHISHVMRLREDTNTLTTSIVNIPGIEGDLRRIGSSLFMYRSTSVHPGWYPIKFESVVVI